MPTRTIADVVRGQRILTADCELSVRQASQRMAAERVGSVMIVSGDKLIGIFTERDALTRVLAAGRDPETTRLADVMTANPQTVAPDRPLGHAMHLMTEGGFRHVPVVVDGRPIGMVSARDALGSELIAFENELEQRESISERL
ncbi:CBS domain-containing protein [Thauera sinica]|uniref:CBS domain-containing protein n=1 Tax=Thauera sinica TaxID=2665146 RepID=A0ABW1AQB1_9RHOO|nr:CBS domain-containing protein [Thauera sp. K11]ATE59562.1 inosine-5-monophosphate dehydrogenase [Thauera sp. K11]